MILEVGKTYKVRMGGFVKIAGNTNKDGFAYNPRPFYGNIVNEIGQHIRIAYFNDVGMYYPEKGINQFDIIEVNPTPIIEKYKELGLSKYL